MKVKMDRNAKSIAFEIPSILATQFEHVLYASSIPAGVSYNVGDATRKYSFDRRKHSIEEIRVALERANIPTTYAEDKAEEERARKIPVAAAGLRGGMTTFAMRVHESKVLGQLADMTEVEFMRPRGVGRKTLNHVKCVLEEHHLSFRQ